MPRPIVLGNGNMLVNFDHDYNLRDLYYPFVGMENHLEGRVSATGVWVDGRFSWLGRADWRVELGYRPRSLVSEVAAENPDMGLALVFQDAVHFHETILLRRIRVQNLAAREREVRLFFNHDLCVAGSDVGDTVFYEPEARAVIHYKRNRYFLINGLWDGAGIWQYSTGIKRFGQREGTWRDAEDGTLSQNPVAQGSVDSTVGFSQVLPGGGEGVLYLWLAAAENLPRVEAKNRLVLYAGPEALLERTEIYWRHWVDKTDRPFYDLPAGVVEHYRRSLLTVRTHMDNRGAILAASDTDIMMTNRDHYAYTWPRDGALIAHAFVRAGYASETVPFFYHCERLLATGGYMWPKYNADGTVGSNWHPWIDRGCSQLPIQEDETALVVWALGEHFRRRRDFNLVRSLYDGLVRPAADFLARYRNPATGLPLPSYDLWEERRGIFAFTAGAVFGGLRAAAVLAGVLGDRASGSRWGRAALEVRSAVLEHLYSEECGRFVRGLYPAPGQGLVADPTAESSLWGLFAFGLLPPTHPRVAATMRAVGEGLTVRTEVGGVARYANDYYFQKSQDICRVPGNPWFISTLWLAQWQTAVAQKAADLAAPRRVLEWAVEKSMAGGAMSEQVHPFTGEPLSVAPLTWSHATFLSAVLAYLDRYEALGGFPPGGHPVRPRRLKRAAPPQGVQPGPVRR